MNDFQIEKIKIRIKQLELKKKLMNGQIHYLKNKLGILDCKKEKEHEEEEQEEINDSIDEKTAWLDKYNPYEKCKICFKNVRKYNMRYHILSKTHIELQKQKMGKNIDNNKKKKEKEIKQNDDNEEIILNIC